MNNIPLLYSGIIGSYCQNLQNEKSDVDIFEIYNSEILNLGEATYKIISKDRKLTNKQKLYLENKYNIMDWQHHTYIYSTYDFCFDLFFNQDRVAYEFLFPYVYLSDNSLTNFIKNNNENFILSILPELYKKMNIWSNNLYYLAVNTKSSKTFSKSLMKKAILIDYAKNKNFNESINNNSYRNFIFSIKNENSFNQDNKKIFEEFSKKFEEVKSYYLSFNVDKKFINNAMIKILKMDQDFSQHYLDFLEIE